MKRMNIMALALLGFAAAGSAFAHTDPGAGPAPTARVQVGYTLPAASFEGGVSIYHYPRPQHMNRVQVLAHRVSDVARQARVKAQANRWRFTWRERGSLFALRRLDNAADRFHVQVERYMQDPAQTESDFRNLVRAYFRAQDSLRGVRAAWIIRRDLADLRNLMYQLMTSYGGSRYWIHESYPNGGYQNQGPDYQGYEPDRDRDHDRFDHNRGDQGSGYDRDGNQP